MRVRVVGVTFAPGYPESLHQLNDYWATRSLHGQEMEEVAVVLIRNALNEHDTNAIEVHVPAIGHIIGHIPAPLAKTLAPQIDAGTRWHASVEAVAIHPDHPEHPAIDIHLEKVDGRQ